MGSIQENVLITGAAGFIGSALATALLETSPSLTLILTDLVTPSVPPGSDDRVTATKCDLTSPDDVESLLSSEATAPFTAVYLLHGLMSGGAEANLALGWRINWDSHRNVIDYLCIHHPGTVVVFASSLAVYGPPPSPGSVTSEHTCPQPQSSYGAQKLMVETYLGDFARRGLLDGRVVRLPTVVVRPGAPSAAASSFVSGIVREPLRGLSAELPVVARGLPLWICSPHTVVANLVQIKDVPAREFGLSRVVNLPGVTVTVQEILDALEAVGGAKARSLIHEVPDVRVEAIVGSWPARFDTARARTLGLQEDVPLVSTVKRFADNLEENARKINNVGRRSSEL